MSAQDSDLRHSIAQPRSWRPRPASDDWRTSLLLLVALLVILPGLHVILTGTDWMVQLGFVSVLVLGAAAVTRLFTARRWVPPLVAAVATLAAFTAVFAPTAALLAVIPTGDTFAMFSRILREAGISIGEQTLPAHADVGIVFVMCIGTAAAALAADMVAIPFGAPALAGVPLLVLLAAPAWIDPGSSDPVTFILAALAYLLLLRVGSRRGQAQLSLGLGAAIVALTIVLSLVLPPAGDNSTDSAGGFGTGVNPVLALGSNLRQGSTRTVLSYKTSNAVGEYLRLVSVSDFSGANWQPDASRTNRDNTVDRIGAAPGLTDAIQRTTDTTTVKVGPLTSSWLPLPYPPTKVTGLTGAWYWSSPGLSVSSANRTTAGQHYTITDLAVEPTPDQLLAAGTAVPSGLGRYLQVPKGTPSIIAATAKKVVGTAPTNYEKALLLQSFFHDDGFFTYSETAPVDEGYDGTGGQVIAKFLQTKSGYCIHFAAAMAMMARTLGIPARISVGFLPGEMVSATRSDATFDVTTHDLHAWPELYFAGIGWIRFEPTVGKGVVPGYADLNDPAVPAASATDNPPPASSAAPSAPADVPSVAPSSSATGTGSGTVSGGTGSWLWVLLVVFAIALLAFTPGVVRSVQRARRIRRLASARSPALFGWREVLQTSADVGHPIADTLTPREAAVALGLGLGAQPSLDRMLGALERERFAKDPRAYPGAAGDTRELVAAVFATVRPRARILARLFPPSLWGRITRAPAAR